MFEKGSLGKLSHVLELSLSCLLCLAGGAFTVGCAPPLGQVVEVLKQSTEDLSREGRNWSHPVWRKPSPTPTPAPSPTPTPSPTPAPSPTPTQTPTPAPTPTGPNPVYISGKTISNPNGPCIVVSQGNPVIIENSVIGPCGAEGIVIQNSASIVIRNNFIKEASTGVYIVSSSSASVYNNMIKNVQGPRPRGSIVQFDHVTGTGNSIMHNIGINESGRSSTNDVISLYMSQGTSSSPILVSGNYIRGGGPSTVGGGIMLGDLGGAYERAEGNIVIDPGQYGMAVAGGTNISVVNNQVYAKAQSFSNIGMYVWAQDASCGSVTISGNTVGWLNSNGVSNPYWDGGGCGSVAESNDNFDAQYTIPAIPTGWGPNWSTPSGF